MNFLDWYTDLVDIYRVKDVMDGNLTKRERTLIAEGVPCRIYKRSAHGPNMTQTAADIRDLSMISCDNLVDIQAGDELILHQGAVLGHSVDSRGFAGEPNNYYEPFGAVIPGLAHQEVPVQAEERI